MREILFRGKRVDNGEWVYGNLIHKEASVGNNTLTLIVGSAEWDIETGFYHLCNVHHVLPETIGQYTGLTDKNGKKIFEGDILNTSNSNCRIWYIDYKNTAFCCNQGNVNYSCVLDEFMQYSSVEVIGNIHDNPELLKVEKIS